MSWNQDQEWEKNWHNNCVNSYWEETKQQVYAKKMGLLAQSINGKFPVFNLKDISVADIGGGPYSLLLKCINVNGTVVDPCNYPKWTRDRYKEVKIKLIQQPAEERLDKKFDEIWIYNCLQHTQNPEKIIKNSRQCSRLIRLFEWIDEPISIGHPQVLTEERLNSTLGGEGKVEELSESGCFGKAYYGIFRGDL